MNSYWNRVLLALAVSAMPVMLFAWDDDGDEQAADVPAEVLVEVGSEAQAAPPAGEVHGEGSMIDRVVQDEHDRRQQALEAAEALVSQGAEHVSQGKYPEAELLFKQAEALLGTVSGDIVALKKRQFEARIESFRIKWANSIQNDAFRDYVNKDYDEAILKINRAQQIPNLPEGLKAGMQKFSDLCQRKIESDKFVEKTELLYKDIDPDNETRNYEMDVAYQRAMILVENKQYTRARDALERILVRDPYNLRATEELKKLYKELRRVGVRRRHNDLLERAAEVQWKWSEAVLPMPAKIPDEKETIRATTTTSGVSEKLSSIILGSINFTDVPIQAVVRFLNAESKRLDPTGAGVNIALGMSDQDLLNVPLVTMALENLPLREVIRYLCQSTNLRYRVDERVLTIGTESIDPMDTRFINVRTALVTRIAPAAASVGADDGFGDGFEAAQDISADATQTTRRSVTTDALISYFGERGVPFPDGSTIAYDRRAGKLVVRNTHENLRRLESLIRDLDLEQPQVLIEAKFIESTLRDLEQLGFEWWIGSNPNNSGAYRINQTPRQISSTAPRTVPRANSLVRPLGASIDGVQSPVDAALGRIINALEFPVFGDNFTAGMMLHAMDRHSNSEVLSAPKVISKSGNEAIIRMVREEYYPENWTEPELAIINGLFSYTPSFPEFGAATDVGIRFTVTPTVSPNNYTINLALNPQVLALTDWSRYDIQYSYPVIGGQVTANTLVKMPIVSRRDVTTSIRVYDGETIVLGGMLRDESSSNDDRIPGAGNVPLLGFLTRVQASSTTKRNLLIFVTARIVSPDGLPVRISPNNGLFDFRR